MQGSSEVCSAAPSPCAGCDPQEGGWPHQWVFLLYLPRISTCPARKECQKGKSCRHSWHTVQIKPSPAAAVVTACWCAHVCASLCVHGWSTCCCYRMHGSACSCLHTSACTLMHCSAHWCTGGIANTRCTCPGPCPRVAERQGERLA